jgi:DNA topoisomerase-3
MCGKNLTDKQIVELITKGKTGVIRGFKSKKGNNFDAILKFDAGFALVFDFQKSK